MKIAIDSNDGINLTSPRDLKYNYFILEMDEKSVQSNLYTPRDMRNKSHKVGQVQNINELLNIIEESGKDVILISRNIGRQILDKVKKSGANVYITFKKRIDDAISQHLKDKMIHKFLAGI